MESLCSLITFDQPYATPVRTPSPPSIHLLDTYQADPPLPQSKGLTFVPFLPVDESYEVQDPQPPSPRVYDIVHARDISTIWSSGPITDELQLLEWLTTNTGIPVPKVVSQGWDSGTQQHYATFATPEGKPIAECWEDLSQEARLRAIVELKIHLKQLRSIEEDILPNHGTRDAFLDRQNGVMAGPYSTQAEFLSALSARIDAVGSIYNPGPTKKAIDFIEAMGLMSRDEHLVMTHGNLNPDNIWVRDDGKITGIVDWSQAGYAPVYWEYIKANLGDDELQVYMDGFYDEIMEAWPLQLAVMIHVHDIIW